MSRVEFDRVDLRLVIRRREDEGHAVFVGVQGALRRVHLRRRTIERWLDLAPGTRVTGLRPSLGLDPVLAEWRARLLQSAEEGRNRRMSVLTLPRFTLEIEDTRLADLDWEKSLSGIFRREKTLLSELTARQYPLLEAFGRRALSSTRIIRVSPVVPRFTSLPLTLPLRILHLDAARNRLSAPFVDHFFRSRGEGEEVSNLVRVFGTTFGDAGIEEFPRDWPTSDVVYFTHLPHLSRPDDLLSTADPDQPGTLGWLSRRTEEWQTRLIVIQARGREELINARRLGNALTARGGPAVLTVNGPYWVWDYIYRILYRDNPADFSIGEHFMVGDVSLFAGAGREDALRPSNVGMDLSRLGGDLLGEGLLPPIYARQELVAMVERQGETSRQREGGEGVEPVTRIQSQLVRLREEWEGLRFDRYAAPLMFTTSEPEGVLSLARSLNEIRLAAGVSARVRTTPLANVPRAERPERYVNSSLWRLTSAGDLSRLDQRRSRLLVGETYHLRVQIGPLDVQVDTYGATAVIEEVFKWVPEMEGVWVEVGVSGLDFDVLGEPVQELWLPRRGASDPIFFAVVPRRENVSCLRFSVYLRQNIIQSFRLAALTTRGARPDEPLERRLQRLARALGVPRDTLTDVGYLPRLEYSIASDIRHIMSRPARALSIVANEVAGRKAITVKGPDIFDVQIPKDLKFYVTRVRDVMKAVSSQPVEGVGPEDWDYGWGLADGSPNAGTPERLTGALKLLAEAGWQLFDRVIPRLPAGRPDAPSQREKLSQLLDEDRQTIHVAHTLMGDVLPWSALYDRKYDPHKQTEQGRPVAHDVCVAALPDADGELPFTRCGEWSECLLSEQNAASRRAQGLPDFVPDTVVCPLHFWGFKHLVEVPAQQAMSSPGGVIEQRDFILVEDQVKLVVGYNPHLNIYSQHLKELGQLTCGSPPAAVLASQKCVRDDIIEMLRDTTLDLIYLYCHAYASWEKNYFAPYLEFGTDSSPARIRSDQFDFELPWQHYPLVFLNGCGTAGFNPEATSPFIEKFVRDRKAAGVVGTEIPVWEQLASEFARRFLLKFLGGSTAGMSLLSARRELLSQNNPLGLAYTLYGPAHLKLACME